MSGNSPVINLDDIEMEQSDPFGGHLPPPDRFGVVLWNAVAFAVRDAEVKLGTFTTHLGNR